MANTEASRAAARSALEDYKKWHGGTDRAELTVDLIADLAHAAEEDGLEGHVILRSAGDHFLDERGE